MNSYWLYIILAGFLEVAWATGLKLADTPLLWAGTLGLIGLSFLLLLKANEKLPVATVYAVFTGIGAVGTVVVDSYFLGAVFTPAKIFFICLLMGSVLGLKLVTPDKKQTAQEAR